jgi:hypothetical protein
MAERVRREERRAGEAWRRVLRMSRGWTMSVERRPAVRPAVLWEG